MWTWIQQPPRRRVILAYGSPVSVELPFLLFTRKKEDPSWPNNFRPLYVFASPAEITSWAAPVYHSPFTEFTWEQDKIVSANSHINFFGAVCFGHLSLGPDIHSALDLFWQTAFNNLPDEFPNSPLEPLKFSNNQTTTTLTDVAVRVSFHNQHPPQLSEIHQAPWGKYRVNFPTYFGK